MGKFIGKILITALAALIAAYFIPGVFIKNGTSAVLLALVLALLNAFVRPILILLTIPITIFTFGFFLLIINMIIIKWSALIVKGFTVTNWWSAFWFSIMLSIVTFFIEALVNRHAEEK